MFPVIQPWARCSNFPKNIKFSPGQIQTGRIPTLQNCFGFILIYVNYPVRPRRHCNATPSGGSSSPRKELLLHRGPHPPWAFRKIQSIRFIKYLLVNAECLLCVRWHLKHLSSYRGAWRAAVYLVAQSPTRLKWCSSSIFLYSQWSASIILICTSVIWVPEQLGNLPQATQQTWDAAQAGWKAFLSPPHCAATGP